VEGLACASVSLRLLITVSRTSLQIGWINQDAITGASDCLLERAVMTLCGVLYTSNIFNSELENDYFFKIALTHALIFSIAN